MRAAKSGDTAQVTEIVQDTADLNRQSRYGWTALMFAAWKGHDETVRALLDAGADPNIGSESVPSGFSTVGGHPPSSALQEAIDARHLGVAKILIRAGADLDGGSVAIAGRAGNVGFLDYLRKQGADLNASSGNVFYATPLSVAASAGELPAVKWLVENGANPNRVAVGQTALKKAIESNEAEIVSFLLEHGADPNLTYGSRNDSPLLTATTKYTYSNNHEANLAIIELLLNYGADTEHESIDGKHAVEFACRRKAGSETHIEKLNTQKISARQYAKHQAHLAHDRAVVDLLSNGEGCAE